MRKYISIFILYFLAANFAQAQDTLYKTNRTKVIVKVQQVGPKEVIYKRYEAPDGPLYVVSESDIVKISYVDGHTDYFNDLGEKGSKSLVVAGHRWTTGLNAFDMMFGMISLSEEYACKKNGLTIRIPVSVGLGAITGSRPSYPDNNLLYYDKNKIFSTGLDLRYFPTGQNRKTNYYLGVSFEYGMGHLYPYYWDFPPYHPPTDIVHFASTGITNGILIKPTDRFSVGLEATFGMTVSNYVYDAYRPEARLGITVGWRLGKDQVE